MIPPRIFSLIAVALILSSCASQQYVSEETDDLYFSSKDRQQAADNQFAQVNQVDGEDYQENDEIGNEYFSVGRESSQSDVNPRAEGAYVPQTEFNTTGEPANASNGGTVNNFYGNTEYYEGGNYDDSYASRVRRFNDVNLTMGYGFYDPFFVDPCWNWGWNRCNTWNRWGNQGLSVGWNSWSGWNVGYSWGWGAGNVGYCNSPWGWNSFGCNTWGWNNFGYNPWAWNQWNSPWYGGGPYAAGYWNGFNDGYYSGLTLDNNRRGRRYGPRGATNGGGFAQTNRTRTPASGVNAADGVKKEAGSTTRVTSSREKFNSESNVFKTRNNEAIAANNQNVRSTKAAEKYSTKSRSVYAAESKDKYQSTSLARSQNVKARVDRNTTQRRSSDANTSTNRYMKEGSESRPNNTSNESRTRVKTEQNQPVNTRSSNASRTRVERPNNQSDRSRNTTQERTRTYERPTRNTESRSNNDYYRPRSRNNSQMQRPTRSNERVTPTRRSSGGSQQQRQVRPQNNNRSRVAPQQRSSGGSRMTPRSSSPSRSSGSMPRSSGSRSRR